MSADLTVARWSLRRLRLGNYRLAPWLKHHNGEKRRKNICPRGDQEDPVPTSRGLLHVVAERNKQRCRALGRIEQAVVGRREFCAKCIGTGGRKQRRDLT